MYVPGVPASVLDTVYLEWLWFAVDGCVLRLVQDSFESIRKDAGEGVRGEHEKGGFNALLFKVRKASRWLYSGEYWEYASMDIYWRDDSCLIINSVPYKIE